MWEGVRACIRACVRGGSGVVRVCVCVCVRVNACVFFVSVLVKFILFDLFLSYSVFVP